MADDKTKVGEADRSRVAAGEPWEISYLVQKLRVTADDVRRAIAKVGNNREAVEAELLRGKRS